MHPGQKHIAVHGHPRQQPVTGGMKQRTLMSLLQSAPIWCLSSMWQQ